MYSVFRTIVFIGCGALMIQFASAPKYALNTYAVVPLENFFVALIFAAHEYLYMFHIWSHQASSIVLCEVFACSYTHIIREMRSVLESLILEGQVVEQEQVKSSHSRRMSKTTHSRGENTPQFSGAGYRLRNRRRMSKEEQHQRHEELSTEIESKIVKRHLDPTTKAPGTEYDIMTLLADYKKLMISANAFNSWAGLLQGGTTARFYTDFMNGILLEIG